MLLHIELSDRPTGGGGHDPVSDDDLLQAFEAVLHAEVEDDEPVVRFDRTECLVVLWGACPEEANRFVDRLSRSWEARRPRPVGFCAGVAGVTDRIAAAIEACQQTLRPATVPDDVGGDKHQGSGGIGGRH